MERQVAVIELWGFDDEEHVQEFFGEILSNYQWGKAQYVKINNLNKHGVSIIDKELLKKDIME